MVRFIKTFIYHHSIDLLTDKERKINVIFQIIIVTFFYIFLSTMMTFYSHICNWNQFLYT